MTGVLAEALATAAIGDVAEAVLIPLSKQGKLRVTYNWLYSALNCDPNDNSDFVWRLTKLDADHIALSPRDQYRGMQLYASVRDDWSWYVQVQAPFSADWITAIGRNEIIAVQGSDLLTISLQGWNGQYLSVNTAITGHDDHAGFKVQSQNPAEANSRTFFLGVTALLQPKLGLPLRTELDPNTIQTLLGASAEPGLAEYVYRSLT